jgi:GT2 family glycosyltransferase
LYTKFNKDFSKMIANNSNSHQPLIQTQLPSVAIVILNWNGQSFLQQFLPSVLATIYANKKIVVVDNASTDNSVEFLKTNFPAVNIISNTTNEGFAKGYNTGLKQIDADYYVLLNSDVEVTPNWVMPIITLLENDKTIAACQPKMLAQHNKQLFEYAGASGGWIDYLGYPFARGRVFDVCEKDEGQFEDAQPCFWASGAALFVKAKIYQELHGLDEYFFAHQEEIDFCWRVQLLGYKVYVEPKSIVYHVGAGTLAKTSNFKTYLNFRNNLIMLFKNLPLSEKIWKIPVRLWLDAVVAYRELFKGNTGFFFSIIKAHVNFVKWMFFNQSQSLFVLQKSAVKFGYLKKSIVWLYFIKKKKTFLEIISSK